GLSGHRCRSCRNTRRHHWCALWTKVKEQSFDRETNGLASKRIVEPAFLCCFLHGANEQCNRASQSTDMQGIVAVPGQRVVNQSFYHLRQRTTELVLSLLQRSSGLRSYSRGDGCGLSLKFTTWFAASTGRSLLNHPRNSLFVCKTWLIVIRTW